MTTCVPAGLAQQDSTGPDSTAGEIPPDQVRRTEKLIALRQRKERRLAPPESSRLRKAIGWLEEKRDQLRFRDADARVLWLSPVLGGLRTGGGLTGGLRLEVAPGTPRTLLSVAGRASLERYWGVKAEAGYHRGSSFGYAFAQYRHMPREDFYGVGPQPPSLHTAYRHDEFVGGGLTGVRLAPYLVLGGNVAYMHNRVGAGTAPGLPDACDRFTREQVPALCRDVDYRIAGVFFELDRRQLPHEGQFGERFAPTRRRLRGLSLDARRGVYFAAEVNHFSAVDSGTSTFTRADLDAHQYIPIRRGYQVVAVRELVSITHVGADDAVPFYLMQTLGGKRTIRGFPSHRFRDVNAWLLNVEYRYQVWHLLDVALFADVGQVFRDVGEVGLVRAEAGYGIGLRFKTPESLLARIDLAHSREGFAVEFSLGSIL